MKFKLVAFSSELYFLLSGAACPPPNRQVFHPFPQVTLKHCQRHNGPEGQVLLTKVTSWDQITSSYTNLDKISSSDSRPSITWISDKGSQWSDSRPIKNNFIPLFQNLYRDKKSSFVDLYQIQDQPKVSASHDSISSFQPNPSKNLLILKKSRSHLQIQKNIPPCPI